MLNLINGFSVRKNPAVIIAFCRASKQSNTSRIKFIFPSCQVQENFPDCIEFVYLPFHRKDIFCSSKLEFKQTFARERQKANLYSCFVLCSDNKEIKVLGPHVLAK